MSENVYLSPLPELFVVSDICKNETGSAFKNNIYFCLSQTAGRLTLPFYVIFIFINSAFVIPFVSKIYLKSRVNPFAGIILTSE